MRNKNTINKLFDTQTIIYKNLDYSHLEDIAQMAKECFQSDAWSFELMRAELEDEFKHYFVAEKENSVICYGGYAQIVDEAHIMNIAVKKEYRKRGLAKRILQLIIEDAKARGIKRATLEVMDTNHAAIKLYENYGFKLAGKRKNYYRNTHDAYIYWKEL